MTAKIEGPVSVESFVMTGIDTLLQELEPPNQFWKRVKGKIGSFKACYKKGLEKEPGLEGKILMMVTLNTVGKVTSIETVEDSLAPAGTASEDVRSCLIQIVSKIEIDEFEGESLEIKLPLQFAPGD